MYPEFIPIYVGLAIALILLVVILVFVIKIYKSKSAPASRNNSYDSVRSMPRKGNEEVVFCTSCGYQYDASLNICPKCGTPR